MTINSAVCRPALIRNINATTPAHRLAAAIGPRWFVRQFRSLPLAAVLWLATVVALAAQGQYAPVTETDVVQLQFNHYFTPDNKGHDADFQWKFTKDEFVIKKGAATIPADLMKRLVPAGTTAEEIRGKWKLDTKEGVHLVLTEILVGDGKGGESLGNREARLVIYRTAPTVVRIGEVQYVFGVGP